MRALHAPCGSSGGFPDPLSPKEKAGRSPGLCRNPLPCPYLILAVPSRAELPGQDSNLDKESQNPNTLRHNGINEQCLRQTTDAGRSAGRSDEQGEGGITDADLARLVAAWPTLPEPIRRAMIALIEVDR